jgi:hypothetical protein
MTKEYPQRVVHVCTCSTCQQHPHSACAREHRRVNRLAAAADERLRRLLVGFLAQQQGRGGIARFARITGLDPHTIARGQRELQRGHAPSSPRVRRPGAGRPRAGKKARAS